ncbi:hypothetical protein ACFSMW_06805 [Virgibacillus halophilus]|uniref:hypothetical protein n=1 Tax=Tigheibacillus halophilus TaxID=361280 RepID=UPI00363F35CD
MIVSHTHFLEQDLNQAYKEQECLQALVKSVTNHIKQGEFELAKHRSQDMLLSLHELSQLAYKKKQYDRAGNLLNRMEAMGIHVEVVRGLINGK